ncbi:hypothetical protein [Aeoliella sp. SH292]|uniref:hypothetical protein n=1 Tax=Aeoliella sp. SH292 TaxID=3454464 RepID=UPI003F9CA1ED
MNSPELEYCGPDWLVRLVGNEQYLPGLWHFRKVNLTTLLPDLVKADVDQLVRWPYLNHVVIRPGCPLYAIENLAELSHLHSLTIEGLADAGNDTRAEQSRDPKSFLRVDQLDQLAELPIDHLTLWDSKILAEDVTRLLSAQPTMRKLTLRETAISADELEALRAEFPQISIAAEWFSVEESEFRPVPSEWHQRHINQVRQERAEPEPPRVKFKYDEP